MFRSDWGWHDKAVVGLVVAILLLASFALPPQGHGGGEDQGASRQIEQARQNAALSLHKGGDPSEYNPPCHQGQQDRQSDLCAQWRAADAAVASAEWAGRSFWSGTILGFLTLSAAAAAAYYAKRAALATEDTVGLAREASEGASEALAIAARTADAAAEQAKITESTAKRQLRAYLTLHSAKMTRTPAWDTDDVMAFSTALVFKNIGLTPALDGRIRLKDFIGPQEVSDIAWLANEEWDGDGTLPAGQKSAFPFEFNIPRDVRAKQKDLEVFHHLLIQIEYSDVFGVRYGAAFRLVADPWDLAWMIGADREETIEQPTNHAPSPERG